MLHTSCAFAHKTYPLVLCCLLHLFELPRVTLGTLWSQLCPPRGLALHLMANATCRREISGAGKPCAGREVIVMYLSAESLSNGRSFQSRLRHSYIPVQSLNSSSAVRLSHDEILTLSNLFRVKIQPREFSDQFLRHRAFGGAAVPARQ